MSFNFDTTALDKGAATVQKCLAAAEKGRADIQSELDEAKAKLVTARTERREALDGEDVNAYCTAEFSLKKAQAEVSTLSRQLERCCSEPAIEKAEYDSAQLAIGACIARINREAEDIIAHHIAEIAEVRNFLMSTYSRADVIIHQLQHACYHDRDRQILEGGKGIDHEKCVPERDKNAARWADKILTSDYTKTYERNRGVKIGTMAAKAATPKEEQ